MNNSTKRPKVSHARTRAILREDFRDGEVQFLFGFFILAIAGFLTPGLLLSWQPGVLFAGVFFGALLANLFTLWRWARHE